MQNYRKLVILSFSSLIFTILLTVVIDYMIGWVLPNPSLVYPRDTTITYETTEFKFTAHINSQGFRGDPLDLNPNHQGFRILTLGDSFTYGWGVNDEAVWSKILADGLNGEGVPTEIANLGWVGKSPTEYADLAEKAIPMLKPDLVIVGVLQGDDLQQLERSKFSIYYAARVIRRLYPNIFASIQQARQTISHEELKQAWQKDALKIFNNMSPEDKERFNALDPEIQQLFHSGLLNPHLLFIAIHSPGYFLDMIDLTNPKTLYGIENLTTELKRIKRVALANRAEVLVVSIPYGIYVNEHYLDKNHQLGFEVDLDMLSSTVPDEAIGIAAEQAGLEYVSVLNSFRHNSSQLFYDLDGHFTPAGNRLFGEQLLPLIDRKYQEFHARKTQ